jgi:hypothetical protein
MGETRNLRVVQGGSVDVSADAAANDAMDGPESRERVLMDTLDDYIERTAPSIVEDTQPCFVMRGEMLRTAVRSLADFARRNRA